MKIIIFTDTYNPQVNGVVTSINDTVRELREHGHEIHIFCPADKKLRKGKYIHTISSFTFIPYPEYKVAIPVPPKIISKIKRIDPDIIHIHTPASIGLLGIYVGKKLNIPIVATYHTLLNEYMEYLPGSRISVFKKLNKKMLNKYISFFYNKTDAITVPSNYTKNVLKQYKIKIKIETIPNGIVTKLYKRKRTKNRKYTILHVGRLCKEKNIDILIKAYKKIVNKMPNSQLLILSKGPYETILKSLVKKLGMEKYIKFLGYVSEEEKIKLYNSSDLFVIPSTTDTQGIVTIEAMASGTPVIAANIAGSKEFVKNNYNGLLFKPNDINDLSKKILSVYKNKNTTAKLVKNAYKTADMLDIKNCIQKLENLYASLINNNYCINSKPLKISVVVCAKNKEKNIESCLNALNLQEIRPEIIVVDIHSTDKTVKIAKKYTKKIFYADNFIEARNIGCQKSKHEIVAYCTADAVPPKNWTKNILKLIKKYECVSGPINLRKGSIISKIRFMLRFNLIPRFFSFFGCSYIQNENAAFRKEFLKNRGLKNRNAKFHNSIAIFVSRKT